MYELSITFEYNISLFCYSCDPIYDLAFRIGHLLKTNLFFAQSSSRFHYSDNGTAVYDVKLCANDKTTYKKELANYNRIDKDDEGPQTSNLIIKLDKNISGHTIDYFDARKLQNFILQQTKSILLLDVSISEKKFSVEGDEIIACFTLKKKGT